ANVTARAPVHTVLSGPAGGVLGAHRLGKRARLDMLLTLDIGGTSTDVALVPGRLLATRETEIAGIPLAVPILDVHTVGAGGGSIARIDAGGALVVGPASAGADPGPACYGRGGGSATVTDATFGDLGRLDLAAAHAALARAGVTGEGVVRVVDTNMELAVRRVTVERG